MIGSLSYFWGMFADPSAASPETSMMRAHFDAAALPAEVVSSFEAEGILELEGVYGLPGVGQPTEIDYMEYAVGGVARTIRVVNRGIALFTAETPELLRLHRFFCVVQAQEGGTDRGVAVRSP